MTPDAKIREAMLLLADADAALSRELGAPFRPAKDALAATVKAERAVRQLHSDSRTPSHV